MSAWICACCCMKWRHSVQVLWLPQYSNFRCGPAASAARCARLQSTAARTYWQPVIATTTSNRHHQGLRMSQWLMLSELLMTPGSSRLPRCSISTGTSSGTGCWCSWQIRILMMTPMTSRSMLRFAAAPNVPVSAPVLHHQNRSQLAAIALFGLWQPSLTASRIGVRNATRLCGTPGQCECGANVAIYKPDYIIGIIRIRATTHLTPHTSHLTPHTSHLATHTSRLTPHASHLTHYTARTRRSHHATTATAALQLP
jgi:hypothetical protein